RGPIRAMKVVLAVGRRGRPRRIGVEGEHLAAVRYSLDDAALHGGRRCVVLGGGDSALEAALALSAQPGTVVTLAHQGNAFARAKSENRERVGARRAPGAPAGAPR
nr:NAD(P)-binding domain-containing protein [Deltaproteobacteria bacterium]